MERAAADESDVAMAVFPPRSGAHWANRDEETERRRSSGAAPTGSRRVSFGVTAGPISGARPDPVSPAVPRLPDPVEDPAAPAGQAATGEWPVIGAVPGDRPTTAESRGERRHTARRRSRLVMAAAVMLSAMVLIGGGVAGVTFFAGENSSLAAALRLGSGSADGKVATAPLAARKAASFELVAATTKATVRTQDLGADLYRITSGAGSGTVPSPVLSDDRVQLLLSPVGAGATGVVEVVLSSKVRWALRFVGGANEQIIDLTGGRISSIDLSGGSRVVDLTLPEATGTVPVRVTGAVEDLSVTSPTGDPVRIRLVGGAKTVAAGDRTVRDVKPGSTLTPKGWNAPDRYSVDAAARITRLSLNVAS